jgi:hypothetical protein
MNDYLAYPEKYTKHIRSDYMTCAICRDDDHLYYGVCDDCWGSTTRRKMPLVTYEDEEFRTYDSVMFWDDENVYDDVEWNIIDDLYPYFYTPVPDQVVVEMNEGLKKEVEGEKKKYTKKTIRAMRHYNRTLMRKVLKAWNGEYMDWRVREYIRWEQEKTIQKKTMEERDDESYVSNRLKEILHHH